MSEAVIFSKKLPKFRRGSLKILNETKPRLYPPTRPVQGAQTTDHASHPAPACPDQTNKHTAQTDFAVCPFRAHITSLHFKSGHTLPLTKTCSRLFFRSKQLLLFIWENLFAAFGHNWAHFGGPSRRLTFLWRGRNRWVYVFTVCGFSGAQFFASFLFILLGVIFPGACDFLHWPLDFLSQDCVRCTYTDGVTDKTKVLPAGLTGWVTQRRRSEMKQPLAWNSGEQHMCNRNDHSVFFTTARMACHCFTPNAVSSHLHFLCAVSRDWMILRLAFLVTEFTYSYTAHHDVGQHQKQILRGSE